MSQAKGDFAFNVTLRPSLAVMSTGEKTRVPELDGLRGLAIGLVLLFHYGVTSRALWPLASQGWIGVDLFFVMSGFLIGGIVLDNQQARNFFAMFYLRRFLRIFPIYYLLLALVALLVWWGYFPKPAHNQIFYNIFHLQNLVVGLTHDYGLPWLQVTWSLAVEEHFYLLLPLLVTLTPPKTLKFVLMAGIVAAVLARIIAYAIPVTYPRDFARFMTFCRMDALFYGVLLALAIRTGAVADFIRQNRKQVGCAGLVFAMGFAATVWLNNYVGKDLLLSTVGLTILGPMFVTVVVMAIVYEDSWIALITRTRALGWLGRRAFGIYLFHMPVLDLTRKFFLHARFFHFGVALAFCAFVMTLCLAALSWVYVEKPLIQRGHRHRYRFEGGEETLVTSAAI